MTQQQDFILTEVLLSIHIEVEDLGRQWYEGKLKKEKIRLRISACSTYLIDQNILLQHICMLKVDLVDY
jgi:hypothetical protein